MGRHVCASQRGRNKTELPKIFVCAQCCSSLRPWRMGWRQRLLSLASAAIVIVGIWYSWRWRAAEHAPSLPKSYWTTIVGLEPSQLQSPEEREALLRPLRHSFLVGLRTLPLDSPLVASLALELPGEIMYGAGGRIDGPATDGCLRA